MKPMFILFFFLPFVYLNAQVEEEAWGKKLENFKIEPIVALQLWSTYTSGTQVYNTNSAQYETVDNRINTHLRRSRLGVKGQLYSRLKFNITTAIDLVGRDLLAGTQGGTNNGASPSLRLWNATLIWKIEQQKERLNLTAGYMTPQIGRESITSAFRSTSMEKSWSQNYLRRQLVGTGPGRAVGLNLGGLFFQEQTKIGFSYDLGIFNPVYHSLGGNSIGKLFAPLFIGRAVLHLGDLEQAQYSTSHKVNYFGKRKGLSIALSAARQGTTELFSNQYVLGVDWLFNWKNLNLDGEWSFLNKSQHFNENASLITRSISSNTGYLRLSYNFKLPKGTLLEPVFMMVQFNGILNTSQQDLASTIRAFTGKDYSYYWGMNYYLNPDLKITLGYTFRQGRAGEFSEESVSNNYYFQSGVGPIHRGNWLGIGVVFVL